MIELDKSRSGGRVGRYEEEIDFEEKPSMHNPKFRGRTHAWAQALHAAGPSVRALYEGNADLQAKRDNKGKPESDYVFTYVGGVDAAYGRLHPYYKTLLALGSLYRAEGERLRAFADSAVYQLGDDAAKRDRSIVSMIADTNTRGAQKYTQGNYLTGANYRQYFQGAARHAEKIGEKDAEGFDHESNFVFNVLMLQHCVALGIGTDDRVKRQ